MTPGRGIWQKNTLMFAHFRKNPLLFGAKNVDREICKRYYFPYYCVPVRYRTKVTVDSSAPPINIPKTPQKISSFKRYDLRHYSHLPRISSKSAQIEKFKDF